MLFPVSPRRRFLPYLVALLAFAAAVALRLLLLDSLGTRVPFVTLFPAVMVAALLGGLPAGLLVTLLSSLLASYFWIEPVGFLVIRSRPDWIALAIFVTSCIMICCLTELARRAQRRALVAEEKMRQLSEKEQATRERLELRDQLAGIAATVPGVIYSYRLSPDGSSCFPYASPTLEQVCGVQPALAAVDASLAFQRIHPDDLEQVRLDIAESARTLTPWQSEFRVNHPRRGEIWIEGHSVPQREPDGGVLWHGFLHDITNRKRGEEALRDSSRFSRKIVRSVREGIIVYGPDLRIQLWNPYMEELSGCSADQVLGHHPGELFPVLKKAGVIGLLQRALAGEAGSTEFAFHSEHKGTTCWVSDTFTPLRNAKGEVIGVIGIVRDITARKNAEEELRGSEARFRALMEQAADGFFLHNGDGRFVDVNRRACESLGYAREELLTMSVFDVEEDLDPEEARQLWSQVQPGRYATLRGRQRRKDGTIFPVEVRVGSYQGTGERLFCGLARDITEREESEQMVRTASRRLELAISSGGFGVWDLDVKEQTLVWNDRMFELYGIDPSSFDGRRQTWIATLHPEDRERVLAAAQAALDGTGEFRTEFRVIRPDARVKTLKAAAVVERDAEGRPLRMIGLNQDVTRERSMEQQLLQAQKMEAVGRLAGGVAHDFNNNLTVILGYAELLKLADIDGDTLRDYLDQIVRAAEHSRDITQQLLAFSRNEIIAPKRVDLNALIRQAEKTLARLIGEDVHLRLNTPDGLWPVLLDPAQVNQIVMNLAVNARDAMPHGGTLGIETRNLKLDEISCLSIPEAAPGEYVQLTVTDTGVGMDREVLTHIFEPFYTTKGIGRGTGLGLATVYGIVSQNGGFIKAYSQPGKGSVFALFFPRSTGEDGVTEEQPGTADTGDGAVLLVEDDANVRQMARLMLENAGYTVLAAHSPGEALELSRRPGITIDCLLTDVIMPGMNGVELSLLLRQERARIGVVYMSGYTADVIAQHRALAPGMVFLQKPFDLLSLNQKVKEAMLHARRP